MKGLYWLPFTVVIAWFSLAAAGGAASLPRPQPREPSPARLRRVTVDLARVSGMQTLVGFSHTNPAPWLEGNCLTLESKTNAPSGLPPGPWRLVNMHAENFYELVKRQGFKTMDLGLSDLQRCFVVDTRVPREWLSSQPCANCWPLEGRLSMKTQYPALFRPNLVEAGLVGTRWKLTSRHDPGGLLARVLPGDTIEFAPATLTCLAKSGSLSGVRSWECSDARAPYSLLVYEVQSTNAYTGAAFRIDQKTNRMVLTPQTLLRRASDGRYMERYDTPSEAAYQLVEKPKP
jgi:hypothetical protein